MLLLIQNQNLQTMDRTQLQTTIADVKPGQKLKLTLYGYARQSSLAYLVDMNGQMIRLDANAVATLSDSDPDRGEQNRTTSVDVLEMFGAYWFIDKMWPQLESVEVLN